MSMTENTPDQILHKALAADEALSAGDLRAGQLYVRDIIVVLRNAGVELEAGKIAGKDLK